MQQLSSSCITSHQLFNEGSAAGVSSVLPSTLSLYIQLMNVLPNLFSVAFFHNNWGFLTSFFISNLELNHLLKFLKYAHEALASVQITVRLYSSPATCVSAKLPIFLLLLVLFSSSTLCCVSSSVWWHTYGIWVDCKIHMIQLPGAEHTATHRFLLFSSDDTVVSREIGEDQRHHSAIHLSNLRLGVVNPVHCRLAV